MLRKKMNLARTTKVIRRRLELLCAGRPRIARADPPRIASLSAAATNLESATPALPPQQQAGPLQEICQLMTTTIGH